MSSKKFRLAIYSKCMECRTSPTIFDTETNITCRNRSKANYPFMTDALFASSLGNGSPTATVIRILYTPTRGAFLAENLPPRSLVAVTRLPANKLCPNVSFNP